MKNYSSDKIRNVAIMGHSGSGKSDFMQSIMFTSGKSIKMPKLSDNNKTTASMGLYTAEWNNNKYNIIDVPGSTDFEGEALSAVKAAYSTIILVDATVSLQVGTQNALELADENGMPRFIFVNKIDSEKADYNKVLLELREKYGKKIAPFHVPWGQADTFKGFVNVVDMIAREYNGIDCVDAEIPKSMEKEVSAVREMLMESVAETSEEYMDKYFSGEEFTKAEIVSGLKYGVLKGDIIPVLCGSTVKNIGMHTLLRMIGEYLPSPMDTYVRDDLPFKGIVFKTISDPFIGKISYVKINQGSITPDTEVYNINRDTTEKIMKVYNVNLDKLEEIGKATAGDIVAFTKLANTFTSDTLSVDKSESTIDIINFPNPQMYVAIEPLDKKDEEKIAQSIQKIIEEDPSITYTRNPQTKQSVLGIQGEIHIQMVKETLKEKYGLDIKIEDLKIPYRETITGKSDVQGKHKKQSGGHGQYGDVKIRFEPSSEPFEFSEELFGGSIPKTYVPAVEKGLLESMEKGVLAGYPVTNIKAVLYDGSYHDVDSSEMAFKIAASIAFKKGMEEAKPVILEPIVTMNITVAEENIGDVISDITRRRGRVLGMQAISETRQRVNAQAPLQEVFKYAIDLKAMTQGRGRFEMKTTGYEQVPKELEEKIIKESKTE